MARRNNILKTLPGFTRIIVYFWPKIRKQKSLMILSFSVLLAEILFRLLEPWPLKYVLDKVIGDSTGLHTSNFNFMNSLDPLTVLTVCSIAVVLFTGMRALTKYFNSVGFALIGNRVVTDIRGDIYRHLQCLSMSFHNKSKSGDLIVRVISDIGKLKEITITALLPLLGNTLILTGMVIIMLVFNWKLFLLSLVTFPIFVLYTAKFTKKINDVSRKQRKQESLLAATAAETIGAIKTVQALSIEEIVGSVFSKQNTRSMKDGVKARKLAAGHQRSTDILLAISSAIVLWFGARLVLNNELTIGDLIVFLAYLKTSSGLIQGFSKYTDRLAKATASGERLIDILDQSPDVYNIPGAIKAKSFLGAIEFKNVDFLYHQEIPILKNINFSVKPGQRVVILGPSGSGKSTIASLIIRLYDPTSGVINIDGKDIRSYTIESLRSQISVILQDSLLFATSIRENILYGNTSASTEDIIIAAKIANVHDYIESLPLGYETMVGERGITMSGGQKQRIAIARAAIRKSPILIFDEPTVGLDKVNEIEVMDSLNGVSEMSTTFLITHNMSILKDNDLIIYMKNGRIAESGMHSELLDIDAEYASIYKTNIRQNAEMKLGEVLYAVP